MGVKIPKLLGSSNYDIWHLLVKAALADKGICNKISELSTAIENDPSCDSRALGLIRLSLSTGPLLNTKHCTTAPAILEGLENLYSPKGFSSDYMICQDFFNTTIQQANGSIEAYLSRINRLSMDMAARDLELLNKVIAAFTLNGLSKDYGHVVSAITQSLRNQPRDKNNKETPIDLTDLYSQLLDELRRLQNSNRTFRSAPIHQNTQKHAKTDYMDEDTEMALHTNTTNLFCYYCKKKGHIKAKCWKLHPEERPKRASESRNGKNSREQVMFNQETSKNELAMLTEKRSEIILNTMNTNQSTWILDSASSQHICADISVFTDLEKCNKTFSWGNANSLVATQKGKVRLCFADTKITARLDEVYYLPDLGTNLISQGSII